MKRASQKMPETADLTEEKRGVLNDVEEEDEIDTKTL